jgi:hypothetical protein
MGEGSNGLSERTVPLITWRDWGKLPNTSVRIVSNPVEFKPGTARIRFPSIVITSGYPVHSILNFRCISDVRRVDEDINELVSWFPLANPGSTILISLAEWCLTGIRKVPLLKFRRMILSCFLSGCNVIQVYCFKVYHDRFQERPFQFIIHNHP